MNENDGVSSELSRARARLIEAAEELANIAALPRAVGSRIEWENGVVWTRAGDDDWRAGGISMGYSSGHVGSLPWTSLSASEADRIEEERA